METGWTVGAVITALSASMLFSGPPSTAATVSSPCGSSEVGDLTVSGDY